MEPGPDAELDRDLAGARAAHRRLIDGLAGLDDVVARRPSLLPGWTVGHVLAHLARNADSHIRLLDAGALGEVADQYEGGAAGREAEIERDAGRPAAELVADVAATADALEQRWATMPVDRWSGEGRTSLGPVVLRDLPFRRWREVEVHRVDLGLGATVDDWPTAYVRLELVRMEMLWAARRPMGLTSLPTPALALPPARRLAWLLGRADVDGLPTAGIF